MKRLASLGLISSLSLAAGVRAELASLDAQLSAAREAVRGEEARKAALTAEHARLPDARRTLADNLARDVRALYRLRRGGLLPLSGGLDAWIDHAARVTHLERMTERDLAALREAEVAAQRVSRALAQADTQLLEQTRTLATLEAQRTRRAEQEAAALRQSASQASLNEAAPGGDGRLAYGLTMGAGGRAGAGFAAEQGALAPPVPLAGPDARRAGAGLSLEARAGTSVRAAAAGRVTYAARHPRHGLSVILDHGEGYRTLYGQLEALDVQVGDALSKSTRLGSAGTGPVYFELRKGAQSLDARAWLER